MKIFDTLIKFGNPQDVESRTKHGRAFSWCHEQNTILDKKEEKNILLPSFLGRKERFFVFPNPISCRYVIKRSTEESDGINMTVSYDMESYDDFIVLTGQNEEKDKHFCLRSAKTAIPHVLRKHYMKETNEYYENYKKIVYCKKNNGADRPIFIKKTEYHGVKDIHKYDILEGVGARKSYGCGLIIPTKVYNHLCNFVQR